MKIYDRYAEETRSFNLFNNNKIVKLENLQKFAEEYNAYPVTIKEHLRDLKISEEKFGCISNNSSYSDLQELKRLREEVLALGARVTNLMATNQNLRDSLTSAESKRDEYAGDLGRIREIVKEKIK